MAERDAFVTLKDHKPNFNNVPTCHLLSPTKSEISRISKEILQCIVRTTARATNVNLRRNTQAVIKWFNNIQDKQNAAFVGFDIVEFYPSINEKFFTEAIDFAKEYVNITDLDTQISMHAKKTLLFSENEP